MPEVDAIRAQLFALQDKEYQVFYSRLMPTLPPETVIGVRVPLLRKLAKQLTDTPEAEVFLQELPHFYYEESALHAFLLESVRDYGTALAATERFLPYVDNWAVCDCFSPKVFAQHKPELLAAIRRWLSSDQVYTVRYGIGMLMRHYLDDAFRPEYLAWVAGAQRGILCQYDASVVFCHCTGKAACSGTAVADRKAAGRVDAQQDHPESSRKPPHPPGAKAGFAGAAHSFTKALRRTTRLTVYNVANLL